MFVMVRDRRVEVRNAPNYGNNPLAMADTCVKQLTLCRERLSAFSVGFISALMDRAAPSPHWL
jgi:hypothetical protein